ncbi:DoxX family protein [Streptomyces sp. CC53]|uniref:DoxX family protein n=1 Tax=unclassified Streptomyces TaxID=2593676 RepID=UPI0008DEA5BA|nr:MULTISPECIES: DoxX family protein [unclassified Streptomyces]OII59498.1 DoxX family protein [Streptomyces sp. CC53]
MSAVRTRLTQFQPYALGVFRIVVGLLFVSHGAQKLLGALGGVDGAGASVPSGTWPFWYAGVIELVGGALVLVGFGTRSAAFVASGAMAYAYFDVHQAHGLFPVQNGGEAAALFSWAMLLLVFTGPGALALEAVFGSRTPQGSRGEAAATV